MKSNLCKLSLCLSISLLNIACYKTQDTLPAETHIGAYTMGFKMNGTNYTTSGKVGDLLGVGAVSYYVFNYVGFPNSIYIKGERNAGENKFEIWLTIQYKDTLGTYLLEDSTHSGTFFLGGNPAIESNIFKTTSTNTGKVTITYFNGSFSPYNSGTILSGTFAMDGVNNNGKIIHITDGRFDIGNR